MKLKIIDTTNAEKGTKDLPRVFDEQIRPDLIKRAVHSLQSRARQPYGADPHAGKKCSAELSRRRRKYRGSYGAGISRVPRKILSRRGIRFNWVGAFAPGTVGGRRAHAPKSSKVWAQKINIKERRKAIRSAIAATVAKDFVVERGHAPPENYPFAITNDFESLSKTSQIVGALSKLGFGAELERSSEKTIRGGRAKLRGRKYRRRKGVLLVVSKDCPLLKSGSNISGVDVATVDSLNAELLAPGTNPGRLTLFTEGALERLGKEELYYCKPAVAKEKESKKFEKKDLAAKKESKKKTAEKKAKKLAKVKAKAEAESE